MLFFSDLTWGPKTGWEGSPTKGAAVTVWGKNLGSTRGSSYVTVNGTQVNGYDYAEWGATAPARDLEIITFWLNSSMADGAGTISVTVAGVTSNTLPFTVMAGTIYFISPSGSNTNNGLYSTQVGGSNGPFRDIYMFNPGLDGYHNASNRNPSGDGQYVVYVRGGTYSTLDVDGAFVALRGPYGGATRQKALIAYPGEAPVLDNSAATHGTIWEAQYTPYGRVDYITVAKLNAVNGYMLVGLWGNYNRVIGNSTRNMTASIWAGVVMVSNAQYSSIYGNLFDGNGYDSNKHDIYVKSYGPLVPGDSDVNDVEVGWNEIRNPYASNSHGGSIFVSRDGTASSANPQMYTRNVKIHDNYFHGGNEEFIYVGDSQAIDDLYIWNNIFWGGTSTSGGLTFYNGTTSLYFFNNTVYQAGAANTWLFWATGGAHVFSRNNIYYVQNGQQFYHLETYQGATISFDHDLFFNSVTPTNTYGVTVTSPVSGNPLFVNTANHDFHVQASSPVIDRGTTVTNLASDYDGNRRPVGSAYDIGAYEFVSGNVIPPSVAIVTPTAGSTVSGTGVIVSATVINNTGLSGVQFKLDGGNLGAEDTTAPYSITWDATRATNGAHILTAMARDTAGNLTESAAVTVTVGNNTDFQFSLRGGASASATVQAGGTAAYSLNVRPLSGFTGSISFACSGAPQGVACMVSPNPAQVSGTITASLAVTVTTAARSGNSPPPTATRTGYGRSQLLARVIGLLTMVLLGVAMLKGGSSHSCRACICIVAMLALLSFAGCGGTSQSQVSGGGTPPGTYTITLTGTSGSASGTYNLTLVVR